MQSLFFYIFVNYKFLKDKGSNDYYLFMQSLISMIMKIEKNSTRYKKLTYL